MGYADDDRPRPCRRTCWSRPPARPTPRRPIARAAHLVQPAAAQHAVPGAGPDRLHRHDRRRSISTALSVVREKERGTMEQVRMAPIGTVWRSSSGRRCRISVLAFVSAMAIVLAAMALFGLPMRGIVGLAAARDLAVPGRRAGARPAHLDGGRLAAGRVPDGAAVVVPADVHALGLHLSDREHAAADPGRHLHRAGAVLPRGAARHRAEGRGRRASCGRSWSPCRCSRWSCSALASLRLRREQG